MQDVTVGDEHTCIQHKSVFDNLTDDLDHVFELLNSGLNRDYLREVINENNNININTNTPTPTPTYNIDDNL